jgi:hypothetical protein
MGLYETRDYGQWLTLTLLVAHVFMEEFIPATYK